MFRLSFMTWFAPVLRLGDNSYPDPRAGSRKKHRSTTKYGYRIDYAREISPNALNFAENTSDNTKRGKAPQAPGPATANLLYRLREACSTSPARIFRADHVFKLASARIGVTGNIA
ncbi:hypothetical protein [Salipiger sp. PrR002]|uniref:hypothetical protein n=1 Tax=Salipiger sp. PrR002 TaxID=2706489 RepID=UPI0013B8F2F1|nr:hypothetical protein [Salipiger sp. PrR002]NDW02113.1 hypothetical protein [Salipiger sp. PrR002]NDW59311.1 hypothetical protein [Salipiger sp. PrR004]